jgi:fructosamine-3-kinase
MLPREIAAWLEREAGIALDPTTACPVGGGCIHRALLAARRDAGSVFLKRNEPERLDLLHGDPWGENASALPDGEPVVYDPASETIHNSCRARDKNCERSHR